MALLFMVLWASSCNLPKDQKESLQEAKEKGLLVGVVENPPYVRTNNEKFEGKEVEILKNFAAVQGLDVKFVEDNESELLEKLEKYELHVVIGGFEKKTIWKRKSTPTVSYDGKHVFLVPNGENRLLKKIETYIFKEVKE